MQEMNNSSNMIVRVARDCDLFEQIGRDVYFDLVNHDKVRSFHIPRTYPFSQFKDDIAVEFGIPVQCQRFWKWRKRPDHTYRPDKPLTPEEELKPVGGLKEMTDEKEPELNLFLEVELGMDHCPVSPPIRSDEDILLFFKLYDPEKGALRYVGRLFVTSCAKPSDILGKLNEMAGFGSDEEVVLYQEIKFTPSVLCKRIDRGGFSFRNNRIIDGDVICFQKALVRRAESCRYPTVRSFLEHIRACSEMEAENHPSGRFTWKINNFSNLTSRRYYSEVFTIDGCKWEILIYPKGNGVDCPVSCLSIYLKVADHASLPIGWSRIVDYSLTVVDQNRQDLSIRRETSHEFKTDVSYGYPSFMSLTELHDQSKGYLAQDTLVVEAHVVVYKAFPPIAASSARETARFVSLFNSLDELIDAAETSACVEGPNSGTQTSHTVSIIPSSEEVESATESLKQCLSDKLKLNMKDKLASALSTLSMAENGLSHEQRKSVLEFRIHFDDFISDYFTFQQDKSVYELQKLQKDLLVSSMKKNRERHQSYKELSEKLSEEEEELQKKLQETRCRKSKLFSDWETLAAESEETKSKYVFKKAKLAEAEEQKSISEERMSRSAAAWSSLKAQFLEYVH